MMAICFYAIQASVQENAPMSDSIQNVDQTFYKKAADLFKTFLKTEAEAGSSIRRIDFKDDPQAGSLRSSTFVVHKGEVQLKAELRTWGPHFRVDVWQNLPVLVFFERWKKNTHWSCVVERGLQNYLEEHLSPK
jgi:hypothetical protein